MKCTYHLLAALLFFSSCDTYESGPIITDEFSIVGKWTLTEAYISSGGPQYWTEVENGEEINFFDNGTFSSNRFTECSKGNFSIVENELLLQYDCEGFDAVSESDEGLITYTLEFYSHYFIVTPTSGPFCIEGCSYKYKN